MLTIFAVPKPFKDNTAIIQHNAIRSWMHLQPRPEIILFGNDEGTSQIVEENDLQYISKIKRNEYGTPLLNDLFKNAENLARNNIMCYVNADIILFGNFMTALKQVTQASDRFMLVGQRWDVDIKEKISFQTNWEDLIRKTVIDSGYLHRPTGIDYFVFTRGLLGEIPPFAVGRTAWDNWLLYKAWAQGALLIDATKVVMAVHQNHDYSHAVGGFEGVWNGPETKQNFLLAGGYKNMFSLLDANCILTSHGLISVPPQEHPIWIKNHDGSHSSPNY